MKEWFGLMFSRNALAFYVIILVGAGMYWMRSKDAGTLKEVVMYLLGILSGYFMGKFANDQPGQEPKV